MATAQAKTEPRFLIDHVSWEEYETLLELWSDRNIRMTYDRGVLELISPSYEHGRHQHILARLVEVYCLERDLDILGAGNTTFRRRIKERGLEPDECYWLRNEPLMRGKEDLDLDVDPPPDLAIEVEVTKSALDRMDIYAELSFPEIWRFDGRLVHVHQLQPDGTYAEITSSQNFPELPIDEVTRWVLRGSTSAENRLIREFTAWVRAGMPRGEQP
ncbi:MAG: Uma2 family endonuclease [Isosphaeraceae bacterium]|nr:Uma2 family endonuclease [Isosphaeraceae bacterium]